MFAILQNEVGGIDTLFYAKTETPRPKSGEILVKVYAVGVNRADLVQRAGFYPPPKGASSILGLEIAGEVIDLGEGVQNIQVGDRVFGLVSGGAYAQFATICANHAFKMQENWTFSYAAALAEAYLTAYLNLHTLAQISTQDHVLIHAASGAVGIAAIHIAHDFGATITASCGAEKRERCQQIGAHRVISRHDHDFLTQLEQGERVDIVLDSIGAAYAATHLHILNDEARWCVIGMMQGRRVELDFAQLLRKRIQLFGSSLRHLSPQKKATLMRDFEHTILPKLHNEQFKMPIDCEFSLQEAGRAHEYLECNAHFGKVILNVEH